MITTFNALRQACGLSQSETADWLRVSLDTVKKWCSMGQSNCAPLKAYEELDALLTRIEGLADQMSGQIDPDVMGKEALQGLSADDSLEPDMPSGACSMAAALAIAYAMREIREQASASI